MEETRWKEKIKPLDENAMEEARAHWMTVGKPLFSLGSLEDAVIQIAGIKGTSDFELRKRGLIIMCADNGVVEEGVTQTGQERQSWRITLQEERQASASWQKRQR